MDSRAVLNRREQDAIEAELRRVAPPSYGGLVADDDPRRCPEGGVGRFHEISAEYDGVRRCKHCRRNEGAIWPH